jgi:hypothetical protein
MAIQPKDLNQSNKSYGDKTGRQGGWQAGLNQLADMRQNLDNGAYQQVIDDGLSSLLGHSITSIKNLDILNEKDVATLYYIGMAYRKRGQDGAAVAPLQIVYSQLGFVSHMLDPFPQYVALAKKELEAIAKTNGEEFVNSCNVDAFFTQEVQKASSGCFIATAACGNPLAPEVIALSAFRDDVLLGSRFGRTIVRLYYSVSPPIAALVARSGVLRRAVIACIVRPAALFVRTARKEKA